MLTRPFALALLLLAALTTSTRAQSRESGRGRALQSAPISDIVYDVTFDETTARRRMLRVAMAFSPTADEPVVLSLPAWTPGAYEISYFARWVSNFRAVGDSKPLRWDKVDFDTWRVHTDGAKRVMVSFDYSADTLDNAMTWARRDFTLFNGTNLFLYPEERGFDFGARVRIHTTPSWQVATGMEPTGPRMYAAKNYHDLVDMPFFVGRFDFDSIRVGQRWVRFASYPAGSVTGAQRVATWDKLKRLLPAISTMWPEVPWRSYTILQIADSSYAGIAALEHQNSHVLVTNPLGLGNQVLFSIYAHEIIHAWNIKRLRPADLWPYQYAEEQPTPWLWMSEGITDYYADLAMVRGGLIDSAGFFAVTTGKIQEVAAAPPVALEDASLTTWINPDDGTGTLYYPKGSLAGLLLDILIRDGSGNTRSLDDVMRQLYRETYRRGRGFTGDQWWHAVSQAAGGKSFADFNARYIDGRDPFPWDSVLPLAGMRLATDTLHEPRIGISAVQDSVGILVKGLDPGGSAAEAGVQPGDYLEAIGEMPVTDQEFSTRFQVKFGSREGVALPIRVRRGAKSLTLNGKLRLTARTVVRIEAVRTASPKAVRIRTGILKGRTDKEAERSRP